MNKAKKRWLIIAAVIVGIVVVVAVGGMVAGKGGDPRAGMYPDYRPNEDGADRGGLYFGKKCPNLRDRMERKMDFHHIELSDYGRLEFPHDRNLDPGKNGLAITLRVKPGGNSSKNPLVVTRGGRENREDLLWEVELSSGVFSTTDMETEEMYPSLEVDKFSTIVLNISNKNRSFMLETFVNGEKVFHGEKTFSLHSGLRYPLTISAQDMYRKLDYPWGLKDLAIYRSPLNLSQIRYLTNTDDDYPHMRIKAPLSVYYPLGKYELSDEYLFDHGPNCQRGGRKNTAVFVTEDGSHEP